MADAAETMEYGGDYCPPLLKQWQDRITAARPQHEKDCEEYEKNRNYAKGTQHGDNKPGLVRTNLIYANQATIVPHVYAKNPEIAVRPSKSIGRHYYPVARKFAQTMELVLDRMFVLDTQLKKRARGSLYSVMNTGEGWLKMIFQRDQASDPIIQNRIHDAQDNLARLEHLIRQTEDEDKSKDVERQRDEIKQLLEGLQNQVEVAVVEGLVIDRILTDDIMILDKTVIDFEAYVQAEAIDHMVWMTKDEYCERFGDWPKEGAPNIYYDRSLKSTHRLAGNNEHSPELVCVHELWHLSNNCVMTFGEGAKMWAREPYAPTRQPERWYPFYRIGWNHLDGTMKALPDTSLQRELQDEYNASRTQFSEAREESMPVRLYRKSGNLTDEDLENIANRRSRDIIGVEGKPGEPLQDDLGSLPGIDLNPMVYDTTPIRGDMEMVSGRGDASTGGIVEAKTATEAEIMQAGLMSRSDYRRDIVEDVIQEMAVAAAEMLLQELTVPQVQYIAGVDAVWPMMPKQEVFQLISIEIRAGSTAKPNQAKEREQWAELLPLMRETIGQIFELQMAGNHRMATVLRQLLKETLRRYDERLDLEELLGPEDEDGNAMEQQLVEMQQQMMQLQQALEQAQQELAAVDQQKMQNEAATAEQRRQEMDLKRMEMQERREERAAARAEAERKAAEQELAKRLQREEDIDIRREEMDREDYRAEVERQFQREMQAKDQEIAQHQQVIQQLQKQLAEMESESDGDDEDENAVIEGLQGEIEEFKGALAKAEQSRDRRTAIIAEYLRGPRDDEALNKTLDKLTAQAEE